VSEATPPEPPPARRRRWPRVLLWTFAVLVVLALVAAGLGVWTVRRAFPGYQGSLRLPGLTAPVTVYRDGYGIPQVYAANVGDLFRAQGYLHAEERFWEMDFRRHVTAGRLAELFGDSQVETDRYIRTLGWRRVAEQEWNLISAASQDYLTAYAAGVNAWLVGKGVLAGDRAADGPANGDVSLEYSVLALQNGGYRIERWTPADSLAWLKAMAWDLRGNMNAEIERTADLASGLTRDQVNAVFPAYPFDRNRPIVDGKVDDGAFVPTGTSASIGPPPAELRAAAPAVAAVGQALAKLPHPLGVHTAGIGSNAWVIGGEHTTTGKPILANDPHLAPSAPGIWMQMGLHCDCGFDVAGYTFSGVPGVVIGHTDRIAWGFTNLDPDVTDLYLERVDGSRYQVDGQWRDLDVRQETVRVAGGKPVPVTVRSTKHGPLLSDASDELKDAGGGYAVALRWTALDPGRTIDALFAIDRSRTWDDFRRAAAMFEVPAQNMVYADVDGNIGYQSPGRIPVRGKGDGKLPALGWDSGYDWQGWIPFDELPSVYNPVAGYVVTANQAVIRPTYQHFLTDDWTYGYRSQRITDMINAKPGKVSVADVQRMQFDSRDGFAPTLVPRLLALPPAGGSAVATKAQALLRDWDYQQTADSPAAAYYNAVWRHLLALACDELPKDQPAGGGDRWFEVVRPWLSNPTSPWWDDQRTPRKETRDDIIGLALRDAADELRERLGDTPADWRWGDLHRLTLRNASFGRSGVGVIEWLFNGDASPTSGGADAVNATSWTPTAGYAVDWVPSMRMIVDMSNLDGSRWVNLTGVSGHAFSPHYLDQFDLWRRGETLPMRWNRDRVATEARDTQRLTP
jgi:penicillin G amidase